MHPVLTHLALHVRDLDACIAFYRDFCGMQVVHERSDGGRRVVWLAEPRREQEFIFVMVPGGTGQPQAAADYSHLGFALESRAAVDALADQARAAGCLVWEPRQEPYPVGYYCGVRDPDGKMVEFSYGQPLGPGAPEAREA
jgi:catechol 2,3-dioxygenase-like lactoylglutathione lyase family enzyme